MIWLVVIEYVLKYKSNLGSNLISSAFSNLLQRGGADRERRDGQQKEDCCDQFVRKVDHCVVRGMMRRQNVSSNCLSHGVYLHKVIQLSFSNKLQNLHRFKLYRIMKDRYLNTSDFYMLCYRYRTALKNVSQRKHKIGLLDIIVNMNHHCSTWWWWWCLPVLNLNHSRCQDLLIVLKGSPPEKHV